MLEKITTIEEALKVKEKTLTPSKAHHVYRGYTFEGIDFTQDLFDSDVISYFFCCYFVKCHFDNITIQCGDFTSCYFEECAFKQTMLGFYASFFGNIFDKCVFYLKEHFNDLSSYNIFTNNKFYHGGEMAKIFAENNRYDINLICNKNTFFDENFNPMNDKILERYIPVYCPEEGSFIAYKVVRTVKDNTVKKYLIKLLIPENARRTSGYFSNGKCRASKVIPLEIRGEDRKKYDSAINNLPFYSPGPVEDPIVYRVNTTVEADAYDCRRAFTCANGIHFFLDRQAAMDFADFEFKDEE